MITDYTLFLESKRLGRIVLTGAPGTGKTSVIEKLYESKHHIIREPARELLKKLKSSDEKWYDNLQTNPIVKSLLHIIPNDNREAFQQMVEKQNVFNYTKNKNGFFDRSLVDEIGFRNFYKKEPNQKLIDNCNKLRYDKVFFFNPWKEIFVNDSERKETFEQSVEISKCLVDGYKDFGYKLIMMPNLSVEERIKFILDNIK